jgi:predicted HTH domain antitoxin
MPRRSDPKTESAAMYIHVEIPSNLPDALQCTPEAFVQEAKMAMAVKLYEMKRLSSGMAAALVGVSRVAFLVQLHRYGVPVIDLSPEELESDVANA